MYGVPNSRYLSVVASPRAALVGWPAALPVTATDVGTVAAVVSASGPHTVISLASISSRAKTRNDATTLVAHTSAAVALAI